MPVLARLVYDSLMRRERRLARTSLQETGDQQIPAALNAHLETGRRGERLAYWYLRRIGYTVVARNLRVRPGSGELDLVAWDGATLVFIEVKTRMSDEAGPPETAVTFSQQKRIAAAAQIYMRGLRQKAVNYRFDVVSVGWDREAGCRLKVIKNAFGI